MFHKKFQRWIPWTSFFLGLLFGVAIALPLAADWLGNVIPEPAGNVWGAAIGAAIAVVGAVYVETNRRNNMQKQVSAWVFHFSNEVVRCLWELNELHGPVPKGVRLEDLDNRPLTREEWDAVGRAVIALDKALASFNKNAERLSPLLGTLDITGMRAFYGLEHTIEKATEFAHKISRQAIDGGARSMDHRVQLTAWCRNAAGGLKMFERLSGQLAPPTYEP